MGKSNFHLSSSDLTSAYTDRVLHSLKQNWRRQVETISCPSPQPENHSRDDDPRFHDDPETLVDFEDVVFYQEDLEGSRVAVLADHPGPLPSSNVSSKKASARKGRLPRVTPSMLTSTPKGRRIARRTSTRAAPTMSTPTNGETSKRKAAAGATLLLLELALVFPFKRKE
jgi:hypothetical protein